MTALLLASSLLLPLTFALLAASPWAGHALARAWVWAPVPALALAALPDLQEVEVPWLLLGTHLGLDDTSRVLLVATGLVWLAAGFSARATLADDPRERRYRCLHLLTLAGNLGAVLALDAASFLASYTVMSLAAYGLIVHDGRAASLRAGKVYLLLAILAEVALFNAVTLLVLEAGDHRFVALSSALASSPWRDLLIGLLLAGFGMKLGLVPLHFWLPLAHPAAPTPASAVLSGAILKTGLLGLLRTLPLGHVGLVEWGLVCVLLGLVGAVGAALIGLLRERPKTVLAYSSVSQMGLLVVGLGAGLASPEAWTAISPGLLLFALHHALAKGTLFLGVAVASARLAPGVLRGAVAAGMAVSGLALAGLPLTLGLPAKTALKESVATLPEPWAGVLVAVLPWTGLTTTLVVLRALILLHRYQRDARHALAPGLLAPWALLASTVALAFPAALGLGLLGPGQASLAPYRIWGAAWPILLGAGLALLALARPAWLGGLGGLRVPEGDLAAPATALARALRRSGNAGARRLAEVREVAARDWTSSLRAAIAAWIGRLAAVLETPSAMGLAVLALIALLMLAGRG